MKVYVASKIKSEGKCKDKLKRQLGHVWSFIAAKVVSA